MSETGTDIGGVDFYTLPDEEVAVAQETESEAEELSDEAEIDDATGFDDEAGPNDPGEPDYDAEEGGGGEFDGLDEISYSDDGFVEELLALHVNGEARDHYDGTFGNMTPTSEPRTLAERFAREERELRKTQPDFDMLKEIERSGDLVGMVCGGIPVRKALEYSTMRSQVGKLTRESQRSMEEAAKIAERNIIERIRNRNMRVSGLPKGGARTAAQDPMRYTAEQLRTIEQRVMNGEKVYLD